MEQHATDELTNHLNRLRGILATHSKGTALTTEALGEIVSSFDYAITLSKLQFNEINVHRSMHVGSSNLAERNGQMN